MTVILFPAHPGAPLFPITEESKAKRADLARIVNSPRQSADDKCKACTELMETAPYREFALLWKPRGTALLKEAKQP